MRALITGYGGFAGGHLAEHLVAATDWQLWGTVFQPGESGPKGLDRVTALPADLRDLAQVRQVLDTARPDLVFHLAGQAFVPDAWADPWATFETNVRGQLNLLDGLAATCPGARIVAVTSNEVYGDVPDAEQPASEDAPLRPANPYGASKAAQDLTAQMAARARGQHVVVIRPFNHIGPRQDSRFVASSLAKQVAEAEAGLRPPVLKVGDLSAERDFTDVRDIVRGYRLAAEEGSAGDVYNLASGLARPITDIVAHFVGRARTRITVEPDLERMRPTDIRRTLGDASRARQRLGWQPEIPFHKTLDDILEDWRIRTQLIHA